MTYHTLITFAITSSLDRIVVVGGGFFLYMLVCIVITLAGYSLLNFFGTHTMQQPIWLLAPTITLISWSIILGITVGLHIPVHYVAPWFWLTTILLAVYGIRFVRVASREKILWLLLLCLLFPVIIMARQFWYGITDYLGNTMPDGWSYMTFGLYIWEHPRGLQGGLDPADQYASHLSSARYISRSIISAMSPLTPFGDTQSVSGVYQALSLFCAGCATVFFWLSVQSRVWVAITATGLTIVSGWISNLLWAYNFDNGLALLYMPTLAGILYTMKFQEWRWWVFIGATIAGVSYTYPEFAVIAVGGAGLIVLPRLIQEYQEWQHWLRGFAAALAVYMLLFLPVSYDMLQFLYRQFTSSVGPDAIRAGEGFFGGLLQSSYQPGAFWGIGNEHSLEQMRNVHNIVGILLSLLTIVGIVSLFQHRLWGISAVATVLVIGSFYWILDQNYSYGAYKFIVMSWWIIVGAIVYGVSTIMNALPYAISRYTMSVGFGVLAIFAVSQSYHTNVENMNRYIPRSAYQTMHADSFRELKTALTITNGEPIVIWVDDWFANQWAVYYLNDTPTYLAAYRMYMSHSHIVPRMVASKPIDLQSARYVLTDTNYSDELAEQQNWTKIWSNDPYILWEMADNSWSLVNRIHNVPNGIETFEGDSFMWLSQEPADIHIVSTEYGRIHLNARMWMGPNLPDQTYRTVEVSTNTGTQETVQIEEGDWNYQVPVHPGENTVSIKVLDQPSITESVGTDPRIRLLGLRALDITFEYDQE
ncbi:MAG: hypothetical protein GFH27_549297n208 [Chloroflexi bacterium AL-W]|nr:hypothetical protein [Chloroflexi bacterium AL-N1]NOK68938.1 hypothetical protein [Chloroflexi bacterium AL-N10]NOK76921.1 hypothetical protein [Chloroflexi bacterium AL-N5]NOK82691.1 hypothetical protein [Chloroflexi bacterium AL-W]NOK90778.1 hypothetical protein [Chloroflexi bacterium AL-N15]